MLYMKTLMNIGLLLEGGNPSRPPCEELWAEQFDLLARDSSSTSLPRRTRNNLTLLYIFLYTLVAPKQFGPFYVI